MTTVKEYRQYKDDLEAQERLKNKFPEYYTFIKEYQEQFYDENASLMTMGCSYSVYFDLIKQLLGHRKPKHIIEYGPGFTTVLIKRVLQDVDYPVKFFSYENDAKYYNYLLEKGFDISDVVEVVDLDIKDSKDFYYVTYKHDIEKHRDVDFIFIDGPGHIKQNGASKPNINLNLELLSTTFNRFIQYTIDGRADTQKYYKNLFQKS